MVTILQTLTEISHQMQRFTDLEYTFRSLNACICNEISVCISMIIKQEGHDGPVLLHWLIREIPSYQTLQYLGIALKHKTPNKD